MALFRRKKSESVQLPPEVQEYYQSERRERMGMTWLLAALTFVVTIVLAIGLFFGGRWAYRQVFDRGNDITPVMQDDDGDEDMARQPVQDNDDDAATPPDTTETPSLPTGPTDEPSSPRQTTPRTGGDELPRTGPTSESEL
jgi:hypothetical protein